MDQAQDIFHIRFQDRTLGVWKWLCSNPTQAAVIRERIIRTWLLSGLLQSECFTRFVFVQLFVWCSCLCFIKAWPHISHFLWKPQTPRWFHRCPAWPEDAALSLTQQASGLSVALFFFSAVLLLLWSCCSTRFSVLQPSLEVCCMLCIPLSSR